ncbi:MAG TPA: LPS export ABC transporter ATP-binding protein [Methylococcaceae bacterium]|nr:LPS export ABC transporter ATP-binding protein [Methylococcaceae bacterium]
MATLFTQDLVKTYGKRNVVDGVSVRIDSGEIVGLLGPNGAGKTTTFYMIAGLVKPDRGTIHIDRNDVTRLPMHARARLGLGYLPQEPSVFRKLTVADNLRAVLQLRPDLNEDQRELLNEELLEEFHITHLRNQPAMGLSGGERRRVEIARALATEPRFILLDEPFAGVDPISVIDIQGIVAHLAKRGIGVLITEHNVRETLHICNRAYIINAGRVFAEGQPDAIIANQDVRRVYLGEHFSI